MNQAYHRFLNTGLKASLGLLIALLAGQASAKTEEAIFAGGCFWCMEEAFEKIKGVKAVESGYSGGTTANPDYESISRGNTGHAEVVRVQYNAQEVSYSDLLKHFWLNIDPEANNQQFCDAGSQYRSAIFALNEAQLKAAQDSKAELEKSGKVRKVYTQVERAKPFYLAEEYHQDYYKKNPLRYSYYKTSCGREKRLKALWGTKG